MGRWLKVGGALALLMAACDGGGAQEPDADPATCDGAKCDDADADGDDVDQYSVVLGGEYEFCLAPADASEEIRKEVDDAFVDMPFPNLQSVRLLLHLSDVVYTEPTELGLELERLGFGDAGDGQWLADCAEDIAVLRDSKAEDPFTESGLSSCARGWADDGGEGVDAFIRYAHGSVHPDRKVEFFSAEYEVGVDEEYVRGSTQLMWAEHPTEPWVVIAFRGTEFPDPGDLWADGNFPKVPFHFGRVHGGFSDALATVNELLDQRLKTVDAGTQIWVTGHSLGGALASLFTAELLHRVDQGADLRVAGMTTFGSPRVGDDDFFAAAESLAIEQGVPLHRVANVSSKVVAYDPIPHLPFRNTFGEDFGHVGAPLELSEGGVLEYALRPGRGLLPEGFLDEVIDHLKEQVAQVLSDAFPHALSQYEGRLEAVIASGHYDELMQCGPRPGS